MQKNEMILWVTDLAKNDDSILLRFIAYLNHGGIVMAQAWRAQKYFEQHGGLPPEFNGTLPPEYISLRFYNMRTSAALDETRTLREQGVRNGDVFLFTHLPEEIAFALARANAIPKSLNPENYPYEKSLSLKEISQSLRNNPAPPINNPWISGSFYLAAMGLIITLLAVMSRVVNPFVLPLILVAAPLLVITVGVHQLRNDERLRDKNFVELIGLVIKALPLLRRRFLPNSEEHE